MIYEKLLIHWAGGTAMCARKKAAKMTVLQLSVTFFVKSCVFSALFSLLPIRLSLFLAYCTAYISAFNFFGKLLKFFCASYFRRKIYLRPTRRHRNVFSVFLFIYTCLRMYLDDVRPRIVGQVMHENTSTASYALTWWQLWIYVALQMFCL